jgi:uncharacterized protein
MSRPFCCRRIHQHPQSGLFIPAGIQPGQLKELVMTLDEFEALRLADLEGMYQEQAAKKMEVSRATFGRIINSARAKVAEALVLGKALRIEGGPVATGDKESFRCPSCHRFSSDSVAGRHFNDCPKCAKKRDGAVSDADSQTKMSCRELWDNQIENGNRIPELKPAKGDRG